MSNNKKQFFIRQNTNNPINAQPKFQETTTTTEVNNEEIQEPVTEKHMGHVDGCEKLYLRRTPDKTQEPLTTLLKGDKVEILDSSVSDTFYKVCTANGLEGYCVKTFIAED